MQNYLTCKNCNTKNPFFRLTCINCFAFLRERIFNIDLGDILLKLIESPAKAFTKIIHSEHKNFIFFIIFFAAIKVSINSAYLSLALEGKRHYMDNIPVVFGINLGILVSALLITSLLYTFIQSGLNNKTRFRDNFAIIVYSIFPFVFGLLILFPIELILFGYTVFSVNPHPFIIKETLAYIMLGFEALLILWAMFLTYMGFRTQDRSIVLPIIFTILFYGIIYGSLYFSARYIYIL